MRRCIAALTASACLSLLIAGCSAEGKSGPKTVRVAGTVYLDGKPLEGADVRFIAEGFAGIAKTGPDGRYELVQGAIPGENRILISKIEGGEFHLDPEAGYDAGQLEAARMSIESDPNRRPGAPLPALGPREVVPFEYSDPSKSKLTYQVPEGGTESADLRLSSR